MWKIILAKKIVYFSYKLVIYMINIKWKKEKEKEEEKNIFFL
jgi:hypothetical protein